MKLILNEGERCVRERGSSCMDLNSVNYFLSSIASSDGLFTHIYGVFTNIYGAYIVTYEMNFMKESEITE